MRRKMCRHYNRNRLYTLIIIGSMVLSLVLLACLQQTEELLAAPASSDVMLLGLEIPQPEETPQIIIQNQAAATVPPTVTLRPTPDNCEFNVQFTGIESIPDGSQMRLGEPFIKTWQVTNIGTCVWTERYQLVFADGTDFGMPVAPLPNTAPRNNATFSLSLVAPNQPGQYTGVWHLQTPSGDKNLDLPLSVVINVIDEPFPVAPTPVTTPTITTEVISTPEAQSSPPLSDDTPVQVETPTGEQGQTPPPANPSATPTASTPEEPTAGEEEANPGENGESESGGSIFGLSTGMAIIVGVGLGLLLLALIGVLFFLWRRKQQQPAPAAKQASYGEPPMPPTAPMPPPAQTTQFSPYATGSHAYSEPSIEPPSANQAPTTQYTSSHRADTFNTVATTPMGAEGGLIATQRATPGTPTVKLGSDSGAKLVSQKGSGKWHSHPPSRGTPYLASLGRATGTVYYALTEPIVEIGRGKNNHLVIDESFMGWETVSRYHARIEQEGQAFILRDAPSTNGVYIGDLRTGTNLLEQDCTIRFGEAKFAFRVNQRGSNERLP